MSEISMEDEKESPTSVARRMYAAISYVVVLFGIGIPMWWYTTQLYRMALPDARMQNLGTAPLSIQLNVYVAATSKNFKELLVSEVKEHFENSDIIAVNVIETEIKPSWLPTSIEEVDYVASKIPINIGDIIFIEWSKCPYEILVTSHRIIYFTTDTTGPRLIKLLSKWMIQEETLKRMVQNMKMPVLQKQDATIRKRVTAANQYDVLITVVNPDPESTNIDWNIKTAVFQYLTPFINSIDNISNITLKSQWLYYVTLSDKLESVVDKSVPEWNEKRYALLEDQLPYLITMFETKLLSHISKNPCLNFIVYVTDCKHAPLHFYNSKGERYNEPNAFLSPRWGGVIFINPDAEPCKESVTHKTQTVVTPNSQYIMSIFITQLRQLIGIPEMESVSGVHLITNTSVAPREWELDALMRLRTFEQIVSARLTLKSLAQLLTEITTIVINDDVGASIHSAVDNAEQSADYLAEGNLEMAFKKSRMAFLSSEAAFYDPSLLALLYFPDDQKYAIYIPLFLPIMIPVIMSLNTIRQWLFSSRKKLKND